MRFCHPHTAEYPFFYIFLFIPVLTHTYTVSGDDHSLVCLRRDREANWNAHCFLTRHSPQISSPPTSTGGREMYFADDVHEGQVLRGLWEDGLVSVMSVCLPMAETVWQPSAPSFSFPCLSLFLFLSHFPLFFKPHDVSLHPPVFSTFSWTRSRGQWGNLRPSVKARSTYVPDSLLTGFGFLDAQSFSWDL